LPDFDDNLPRFNAAGNSRSGEPTQPEKLFRDNKQETTLISGSAGTARLFLPGDIIDGSYQLTKLLGRGGMGIVFACKHLTLGSEYALKLLNGDDLTEEHWKRFRSEGLALAKLNHPGIVTIFNMGIEQSQWPYYVMELLSGETLASLIESEGSIPPEPALSYFMQLADALQTAHQQGIVHRDVKPANIMLVRDAAKKVSRLKLLDFGIARLSNTAFAHQTQTATGLVFGTPYYMSPEQCQGQKVDERSDIYSLGCTLFEALTGSVPFQGRNTLETFMMHLSKNAPTLKSRSGREFAQPLEAALAKMLEKDPADRYQSMEQVKHDLQRILQGKEILIDAVKKTIPPAKRPTLKITAKEFRPVPIKKKAKSENLKLIVAGVTTAGIGIVGLFLFFQFVSKPPPKLDPMTRALSTSKSSKTNIIATSNQEMIEDFDASQITMAGALEKWRQDETEWGERFSVYISKPVNWRTKFRAGNGPSLDFPNNFSFGQIRIGGGLPQPCMGNIYCPPGKKIYWLSDCLVKNWPQVIDKFYPNDLDGIEMVFAEPRGVIEKIRRWPKLEYISFFHTYTKAMQPTFDESNLTNAELPLLENFPKLKALGVCGPRVTGDAVARMPLLHRISCLKIKRIANIDALLNVLPEFDNIKELWLVDNGTTDAQLAVLAKMKNLETLCIRRSKVTEDSLREFKRMPALKHLHLDNAFDDERKKLFQKELPSCEFEPYFDFTYWQVLPR
jgi:serine/threonine protein kinase